MLPLAYVFLTVPSVPFPPAGLIPVDAQWAAMAACPRVSAGPTRVSEGPEGGGLVATAVCIGHRDGFAYLLTASHAVPDGEARAYEFYTRESYPKPARVLTHGEVVVRLADPDIALIKLPEAGEPVRVLPLAGPGGRPKRFPFAGVSLGCADGGLPRCRDEKVVEKVLVRRPGGGVAFYWRVAVPLVGGMSGGPLLGADGKVIGICSATQGGVGYCTHLDEVLYGLEQNGYGWLFRPPHGQ